MATATGGYRFSLWQRLVLGTAGAALTTAGGLAVFLTENGPGSAALIAGGLAALTIALIGRLVGFKVAGAEATFGLEAQQVDEVQSLSAVIDGIAEDQDLEGDKATAEALRVAAERLQDVADTALSRLRDLHPVRSGLPTVSVVEKTVQESARLAQEYEIAVIGALGRVVAGDSDLQLDTYVRSATLEVDAILATPVGRVLVELKYLRPESKQNLRRLRDGFSHLALHTALATDASTGLLIVPRGAFTPGEQARAREMVDRARRGFLDYLSLVEWSPGDDEAVLSDAVHERVQSLADQSKRLRRHKE